MMAQITKHLALCEEVSAVVFNAGARACVPACVRVGMRVWCAACVRACVRVCGGREGELVSWCV